MDFPAVKKLLNELQEPEYRFKQLIENFDKYAQWSEMTMWSKPLRDRLSETFPYTSFVSTHVQESSLDSTIKAALKLQDERVIETVLMEPKPGHISICVSSEVGCPMNCAFCATGQLGFTRLLTSEEIADQILFWKNYLKNSDKNISSIVFMGMGEPFHNTKSVFEAIFYLHEYYGFGYRHLSVSTCGIPEGIEHLSSSYPQVNLAISLHAGTNELRNKLMPVNKAHDLESLKQAVSSYMKVTNREVIFEYLLLEGLNDTKKAADSLIEWLDGLPRNLTHINLIRYNETDRGFVSPSKNRVHWFKEYLVQNGVSATIRKKSGY